MVMDDMKSRHEDRSNNPGLLSIAVAAGIVIVLLAFSMVQDAHIDTTYYGMPDSEFEFVAEGKLEGVEDTGDAYIYDLTYTVETGAAQHIRVVDQSETILLGLDWGFTKIKVRGVFVEGSVLMCQAWEVEKPSKNALDINNAFCPKP